MNGGGVGQGISQPVPLALPPGLCVLPLGLPRGFCVLLSAGLVPVAGASAMLPAAPVVGLLCAEAITDATARDAAVIAAR
jgi:hypothetical protein